MFKQGRNKKEEMLNVSTAPSTEGASAIPEALRQAIAAAQGRVIEWPSENQLANAFPVAAEMKKKAAAVKAAEEERRRNPELGDFISGEGVYMGTYIPTDSTGTPLGKTFSVYAAPEDLPDRQYRSVATYIRTVEHVAALQDWHGHNGIHCASALALTALYVTAVMMGSGLFRHLNLLTGAMCAITGYRKITFAHSKM